METPLQTAHFLSPFGCFRLQGSYRGLRSVQWVDRKPCPAGPIPRELKRAVRQLTEYFRGDRQQFELDLDWEGTSEFDQSVWRELMQIPYGRTTSYQAIADKLGDAKAIRAVGQANKRNPMSRPERLGF